MFRLSLFLIALAGFGALVAMPDTSPRAVAPADDRAARVYGESPQPQMARTGSATTGPAADPDGILRETLPPEDDADDLLTITTTDGEVIRVAVEIPPARIGTGLVRIEADDQNSEVQRLAEANARARAAVAERAAALTATPETATAVAETAAAAAAAAADMVYATGAYINLRSGPSTSYPAVGFMNYGTAAERLETLPGGWTQIRILETGLEGFMFSAYLSERAP
jgi:SH3 domain-containing protein